MSIIKNIHPLSAEQIFDLLKKEFTDYINSKLDSEMNIEFAHVDDVINVLSPDVLTSTFLTITVSEKEITVGAIVKEAENNTGLLEEQLTGFLEAKAG
jgi:hypothetical protein